MATKISVTSTAFTEGQSIPRKYTCDGDNVNPPLTIENVPAETKSLVLIVDDPDAPGGTWDHWVVWDIPAVTEILENSVPGTQGMNDSERQRYELQDLLVRQYRGADQHGKLQSELVTTGAVASFLPRLAEHGVQLSADAFQSLAGAA